MAWDKIDLEEQKVQEEREFLAFLENKEITEKVDKYARIKSIMSLVRERLSKFQSVTITNEMKELGISAEVQSLILDAEGLYRFKLFIESSDREPVLDDLLNPEFEF